MSDRSPPEPELPDGLPVMSGAAALSTRAWQSSWMNRVREVDDSTLDTLSRRLLRLRRFRRAVVAIGLVVGGTIFGMIPTDAFTPLQLALFYSILGLAFAVPLFIGTSLAVRVHLLREAKRHGLSTSAALLVVTLAERRARKLLPVGSEDAQVEALQDAIRDWEVA